MLEESAAEAAAWVGPKLWLFLPRPNPHDGLSNLLSINFVAKFDYECPVDFACITHKNKKQKVLSAFPAQNA